MALTSLANAAAGMGYNYDLSKVGVALSTGVPFSTFYSTGFPPSASVPSPGMGGAALTTYTGQIPFVNPTGGQYTYLGKFSIANSQAGTVFIMDRLWHNSGINVTSTGAQAVTSVAWPARDANESTNGEQVLIAVEVTSTMGAATPTITLDYTNSSGTAGRTGTNIIGTTSAASAGYFYPISLQAGDTGVRSIQNVTLSASWISGSISLVAYRVLVRLETPFLPNTKNTLDTLSSGAVRFFDNSVPFMVCLQSGGSTPTLIGSFSYTRG